MSQQRCSVVVAVCVSLFAGVLPAWAANVPIDLEWRPQSQTVNVGDTVNIGLYAVASQDQSTAGMRLCLQWNPTYLNLLGVNNNGPYTWNFSGFNTSDPLNQPLTDGDGLYRAMMQLGVPATATPTGLLVTTLQFQALAQTPGTLLTIPATLAGQTTTVWGTSPVNVDLTRALGSAQVEIVPEPMSALLLALGAVALLRTRR